MFGTEKSVSVFIFLALILPFLVNITPKNGCASYFDYLLVNFGGNCSNNPDVYSSVPLIIEKHAKTPQIYDVVTEDGYVLQMFRIHRENPIGVILLQPPVSTGSMAWLSDGDQSLAFELWRKGYDVWLSNHRGTTYSQRHVKLSEEDPQFWNYGFHEVAVYDLEAQFNLIAKETKSKIVFIGYSMASTAALVYASLQPERAQAFVQSFVLMAPLAASEHISSPFKYIFPIMNFLKMGEGEFPTGEIVRWLGRVTVVPYVANIITSLLMGWTLTEMDPVLYPYIFAHHGRGMSNQIMRHYGQIFSNKTHFIMYDYGEKINQQKYGTSYPPPYPLQNIRSPIYVVFGEKDRVTSPLDIKKLCEELLPKDTVAGVFAIENYNHVDFMFSKHRRNKTYSTVFKIVDQIQNQKP